jgi:hypothetical protein
MELSRRVWVLIQGCVSGKDAVRAGNAAQLSDSGIGVAPATAVVEDRCPSLAVGNEQPPGVGHLEWQQPWQLIDQACLANLLERRPKRLPSSRPGSVSLDRPSELELDKTDLLAERPEATAENHAGRIGGSCCRGDIPEHWRRRRSRPVLTCLGRWRG